MRGWLVEKVTDAGEMAWVERPDPVPGPDEYVVRGGPDEVHRHQFGRQELAKYAAARTHA
jgi:hypothetical protein